MREVIVKHRDMRGEKVYKIYETEQQLLQDNQNAKIVENLNNAKEGDYIKTNNGWIVPIIGITELVNKRTYSRGRKIDRKTFYTSKIFHLPKQKICVSLKRIEDYRFDYIPRNSKNIHTNEIKNRMWELSTRKIMWANHIKNGYTAEIATMMVYPRVKNQNKLTKMLLLNEKLMDYIFRNDDSWRANLRNLGIDENYIMSKIKEIIDDERAETGLKKWALGFLIKVLAEAE